MPEIPNFDHNGISINTTEPPAPMGPLSGTIPGWVGTAPDRDASLPLNVPIRIANPKDAALLDTVGDEAGTLYHAVMQTLKKAQCVQYVVIVEEETTAEGDPELAATTAKIIGGVDATSGQKTGISALPTAAEVPNVIAAPGFSHQKEVADALASMGRRIRARVLIDAPDDSVDGVTTFSGTLGGEGLGYEAVYMAYQQCQVYSKAALGQIFVPPSTMAMGCFAAVKPWESPGNQGVYIDGVSRDIDYNILDKTHEGDLLNRYGVSYFARTSLGGFSLIGNRALDGSFISHTGLADEIARKLCKTAQRAMAKNLDMAFMRQELRRIDNFGQNLVAQGVLPIFECYLHPTPNTVDEYRNGTWYIVLNYARYSPNEHMVYQLNASEDLIGTFVENMLNG